MRRLSDNCQINIHMSAFQSAAGSLVTVKILVKDDGGDAYYTLVRSFLELGVGGHKKKCSGTS